MKVTPDIIRHEFIGKHGLVAHSPNTNYVGLSGLVVGETKNTFTFQGEDKTHRIIKEHATFDFTLTTDGR